MGANYSLGFSDTEIMKTTNDASDCEKGILEMKKILPILINQIKESDDKKLEDDFNEYGLKPGQQIRRKVVGKTIIPHPAIYIFKGEILELGTGPKGCKRDLGHPFYISKNMLGVSSLNEFKKFSNGNITVINDDDYTKEKGIERLERAKEMIGEIDYNFFTNDCIHVSNYILTGNKSLLLPFNTNKSILKHFGKSKKFKKKKSKSKRKSKRKSKNF